MLDNGVARGLERMLLTMHLTGQTQQECPPLTPARHAAQRPPFAHCCAHRRLHCLTSDAWNSPSIPCAVTSTRQHCT